MEKTSTNSTTTAGGSRASRRKIVGSRQCASCGETIPIWSDSLDRKYCALPKRCQFEKRTSEWNRKRMEAVNRSRRLTSADELERLTKSQARALGYRQGFERARNTYHYKAFVKRLLLELRALSDSPEKSVEASSY